ncbi:MAG: cytochrome P450 [Akkermansiaceae bacterium]|jgi:cytochrome P450|nr:cytochrome P450 [Luteolibacter sp.]
MNEPLENDKTFDEARQRCPVAAYRFQNESIPMILRHSAVMEAAKDWKTFSSDAPFRVPIPSEEKLRKVRQLPIETDPPLHGEYRAIVEPFFKKPRDPVFAAEIVALIDKMIDGALIADSLEVVSDFAVPLQSKALAHLLALPESEADEWIAWGTHVFHNLIDGNSNETAVDAYIARQLDRAAVSPSGDFFSALTQAEFQGRKLTRDEMAGFANLTFAGGRDTVIHTITSVIAYLARHPEALEYLRADPKRAVLATEEFFRVVSPLTHIGRVCPVSTNVHGINVPADGRISLGWASANRDPEAFPAPDEVRLDRKPNPHIAFGAGDHFCLGAFHARLIIRELIKQLSKSVSKISIIEEKPNIETTADFQRQIGYERLVVKMES